MTNFRTGLLGDIDLDGCSAAILANRVYSFSEQARGAYASLDENLERLKKAGVEKLVTVDLCLTMDQLIWCLEAFKEIDYYDHHQGSIELSQKLGPNVPRFNYFIKEDMCSTKLVWHYNRNSFKTEDGVPDPYWLAMSEMVNVYDLWQTNAALFKKAYDLNSIYWHLGYDDFMLRFDHGFKGFNENEKKYLETYHMQRNEALLKANRDRIDLDSGSAIWFSENKNIVNDFALEFPKHKAYYMVRFDEYRGCFAMSVRLRKESEFGGLDLNKAAKAAREQYPDMIVSCGGHKTAAGVNFKKGATSDDIQTFILAMDEELN